MPVRMVSAMVASLLSGAVAHACPCAVAQAHACATEARVVRRELGIIRCILNCLLSIVAGFLWRVEGGGGVPKKTTLLTGCTWCGILEYPRKAGHSVTSGL